MGVAGGGDQTQGPSHAKQVLLRLSYTSSPENIIIVAVYYFITEFSLIYLATFLLVYI